MKKQSAVGLFFSMFLRAAVVILGLAIIVFGIVFLMKVVKGDGKDSDAPQTTVGSVVLDEPEGHDDLLYNTATEAPEAEEPVQVATSYDKKILVLNSTNITGLAGRWCERLNSYGYANTEASDYAEDQTTTKIIAVEEGVGQDLVQYFNGATYEVGVITSGTTASLDGVDIVIIIGYSDNDQ